MMLTEKQAAHVNHASDRGEVYVVRASTWEKDRFVLVRAPSALQAAQKVQIKDGVDVEVYSLTLLTRYAVIFSPVWTEGESR